MADIDILMAAAHVTVVDPAPSFGGQPMWVLTHFDNGKRTGRSIALHEDLREWLRDLEAAGRVIGLSWEMHHRPAPPDWPADLTSTARDKEPSQ